MPKYLYDDVVVKATASQSGDHGFESCDCTKLNEFKLALVASSMETQMSNVRVYAQD